MYSENRNWRRRMNRKHAEIMRTKSRVSVIFVISISNSNRLLFTQQWRIMKKQNAMHGMQQRTFQSTRMNIVYCLLLISHTYANAIYLDYIMAVCLFVCSLACLTEFYFGLTRLWPSNMQILLQKFDKSANSISFMFKMRMEITHVNK